MAPPLLDEEGRKPAMRIFLLAIALASGADVYRFVSGTISTTNSNSDAIMTATTARRSNPRRTREREASATLKSTAYGRTVLRALDQMKATGPWQLGPKASDRYFKR